MTRSFRLSALLTLCLLAVPFGSAEAAQRNRCLVKPTSPLVVNVKDRGAKGNGRTDDTKAIQRAINEVAGTGGTVYLPNGTYMVRAEYQRHLVLKSKMTFKMAPKATLKMFPTSTPRYVVLFIPDATDVVVSGGTLVGDRKGHKGRGGEKGMGIRIERGSKRITVVGVESRYMWGDGFNLRQGDDIALCSVRAEWNRRQGLSIIEGNRILVTQSVFRNTRGTQPSAGIDIEPFKRGQQVSNVRIERSKFINNDGGGIMLAGKFGRISRVQIQNNQFEGVRPLLIEYAPKVGLSGICQNRHAPFRGLEGGFDSFAHVDIMIAMQKKCSRRAKKLLW